MRAVTEPEPSSADYLTLVDDINRAADLTSEHAHALHNVAASWAMENTPLSRSRAGGRPDQRRSP